jgi:glucose-6-phosphate isomerase, archaeal
MNKAFAVRTHGEMKEVLKNPEASGPEEHYYMIRGGKDKKNITIWESGKVGDEFIKAYGHYHIDDLVETYWILEGSGILLLQMRKKDNHGNWIDDEIEWVKAIHLKAGDKYTIAAYCGHLMINTSPTWLVTSDDSPVFLEDSASKPKHADYEPVKKMRGFAYYVVTNKGEVAFLPNPTYKNVPPIVIM